MLGLGIGLKGLSNTKDIVVGDAYGGGIVFWVNGSGGGLIVAPTNETASIWGCGGSEITGADGTDIGTGKQNTIDINATDGGGCTTANIAADRCRDKDLSGYTDWFLPSKDELNAMYLEKDMIEAAVGSFPTFYYWSSSEASNSNAWEQYFGNGAQSANWKDNSRYVRAIRSFGL